jgi:NAD(P)-dependent dehydrogenase (short-subunit alcohol dehydrogenase family)
VRCLIVGANASIASDIFDVFTENNYEVIPVVRESSGSKMVKSISYEVDKDGNIKIIPSSLLKGLDVVIFCNGRLIGKSVKDYNVAEIEEAFDANIVVVSKFVKYLLPYLNKNSSVVFLSSISASAGSFDEIYSASKSALYGFTKSLAKNTKNGVRFNCVSPGLIEKTQMYNSFTKNEIKVHKLQTPTKKLVSSKDLAAIIFDICQPHWGSLNGQIIGVNGGRYV